MWNAAVNMLLCGSGIVTFDGSPLRDLSTMFDLLEKTGYVRYSLLLCF
jgi:hypothetical protein